MPTETEQQKQTKTLQDIANILRAGQTPADKKRLADAQRDAAEAQKAAADAAKKDKPDREKAKKDAEEDKKQKKTTQEKTLGLFATIKNDVTDWALKSDKNQITWGNLGKTIKDSVKNWFKEVAKTNSLLGRTFRVGAALWNNVFKKIGENFRKAFDAVTSQVREVLGPVAALYDIMISTLKGIWESTKSVFGALFQGFKKVPPADKKRNKFLRGMLHEMIRARKGKFTEGLGAKKGGGLFGKLGGMFGMMAPLAIVIVKVLVALWAIWKIVQGFMGSSADTWAGKFKDGIKNLLFSIIKWPLTIFEWLLGKLGFASDGFKDAVMGWISKWIDFVYGFTPLASIINFIEGFFKTDGTFMEKLKGGFEKMVDEFKKHFAKWGPKLANAISPIIEGVINFFTGVWNIMIDWMIGKISGLLWFPGKSTILNSLAGMGTSMATTGAGANISEEAAKSFGMKHKLSALPLTEIRDLMAEYQARKDDALMNSATAIIDAARESGGYKTEVKQIVEESESAGIVFGVNDMEFTGGS